MDLGISGKLFLVSGASSGLGKAVALSLLHEGANILAVARNEEKLLQLQEAFPQQFQFLTGDITQEHTLQAIKDFLSDQEISGALINAGGPPAMSAMNSTINDWDEAYRTVFRWKVSLTQFLVEKMLPLQYGRILFIESVSVKQPVENLVLSNSMRLAVVGFVKTLSQEIGSKGINLNILGPGYHATQRMEDLFQKNSKLKGVSVEEIKAGFEKQVKVGHIGQPDDFASLATWLLAPVSRYITGQTISVDGGLVLGSFG